MSRLIYFSYRLTLLGIVEAYLGIILKPTVPYYRDVREVSWGALDWTTMVPRDASFPVASKILPVSLFNR